MAKSEAGPITGLHFDYYKDTRSLPGGRLKSGSGPGGGPALDVDDLFKILRRLLTEGVISKEQIHSVADAV